VNATLALHDPDPTPCLRRPISGVRNPSSLGVARYCEQLARALRKLGAEYELADRPVPGRETHFHLANSSRRSILAAPLKERFLVTVHDVLPRTPALRLFYRSVVYPRVVERAEAVIVHSHYAANLVRHLGVAARRLEVIPHAATRPSSFDRRQARETLRLDDGRLIAVLPGVIKSAKLVREAVSGAARVGDDWLLVLAGPVHDRTAAAEARRSGVVVVESPDDVLYEQAIVAADVVLCLRDGSVGETNGPLLDAIGAGRPVLATRTGSIPEIAGDAAMYVAGSAHGVAAGLKALTDHAERARREQAASSMSAELGWDRSARAHVRLFAEIFGD
jgi:glycosyltransferase involved in cell wall biosynthesis